MAYGGGDIVGVDPATESGIARGVPGAIPLLRIMDFRVLDTDTHETIFKHAMYQIAVYFSKQPPEAMFIEPPLPPRVFDEKRLANTSSFELAMGIYAIFVGIAAVKGVVVYKAPIRAWRATFFGEGNGNLKREVAKRKAKEACRILGWDCLNNDNAAESGGIWTYGVKVLAGKKFMPQLDKLTPLFAPKEIPHDRRRRSRLRDEEEAPF